MVLQRTGIITISDIEVEKEFPSGTVIAMHQLVEELDYSGDLILNLNNPADMISKIQTKAYKVSDWYGYDHAKVVNTTVVNSTIDSTKMGIVKLGKTASLTNYPLANHLINISTAINQSHLGAADGMLSNGPSSDNRWWPQVEITTTTDVASGLQEVYDNLSNWRGCSYEVSTERWYFDIDVSDFPEGVKANKVEFSLTGETWSGPTHTKAVLIAYTYDTFLADNWQNRPVISNAVAFSEGTVNTFTFNKLGLMYLEKARQATDKKLRIGIALYEPDVAALDTSLDGLYIGLLGTNLLPSASQDMTSGSAWAAHLSSDGATYDFTVAAPYDDSSHDFRRGSVCRTVCTTDCESNDHSVGGPNLLLSSLSASLVEGTWYFFTMMFRYKTYTDQNVNGGVRLGMNNLLDVGGFWSALSGPAIGVPTQWTRMRGFGTTTLLGAGHDLTINAFRNTADHACYKAGDEFLHDTVFFGPAAFTKQFGNKYSSPSLTVYFAQNLPVLSIGNPYDIGNASGNGSSIFTVVASITSLGESIISLSGIRMGITNPPTESTASEARGVIGNRTWSAITAYRGGETNYVQAFATNTQGTGLSGVVSFTAPTCAPLVNSGDAADLVSSTSATASGVLVHSGGLTVTEMGICYGTGANPTTANSKIVASGTSIGSFQVSLTGLTGSTTYHFRAYATNAKGTNYGVDRSFTTANAANLPAGTIGTPYDVANSQNNANSFFSVDVNLTSQGSSAITRYGVRVGTTNPPVTGYVSNTDGTLGSHTFTNIAAMSGGVTNYVQIFVENSYGTFLGGVVSFSAPTCAPSIASGGATYVTNTSVHFGGNCTDSNGLSVTAKGICYSSSNSMPTTADSTISCGTGTGEFSYTLTGLTAGTTYYLRTYATNSKGTNYGAIVTITTAVAAIPPSINTTSISGITASTAASGGTITTDGGSAVTARGVCWSTSQNPTTADSKTTDGTGSGTFTSSLTGLSAETIYYVRAYATNAAGTTYGAQESFTSAAAAVAPTVTTTSITANTTGVSATSGGNVTDAGNATVSARGVCWSTAQNPTTANSKTTDGSGIGSFSSSISGLTKGTTYYVRAYATNVAGTGYGSQVSFTTPTGATVTTASVSVYASTTATLGGNVTADGGSTVTSRGVCWATTQNPTKANSYSTYGTGGTGSFSIGVTGLTGSTLYYVRAWATNGVETTYGTQTSFTTSSAVVVPTVTTGYADPLMSMNGLGDDNTIYISGNNVTADGGATITERGVCWNLTGSPTTSSNKVTASGTTGTFDVDGIMVAPNATLYYRTYAINSAGTGYGTVQSATINDAWWSS
ncbi:MAG: hypothetical protein V2A67_04320 [Bacteroidota bacterium]